MATRICQTTCGLLRLSRGRGIYTVSRGRAKKLIGQVLTLWSLGSPPSGCSIYLQHCEDIGYPIEVFTNSVYIGCQTFSRFELEEICRHYGWHGY